MMDPINSAILIPVREIVSITFFVQQDSKREKTIKKSWPYLEEMDAILSDSEAVASK